MMEYADIGDCVRQTAATGLGLAPQILSPWFVKKLQRELMGENFQPVDGTTGKVHQKMARLEFHDLPRHLEWLQLLLDTASLLVEGNCEEYPNLARWRPMETAIQLYGPNDGIQTHRDWGRHPYFILIFNIMGSCEFEILESRDGPVARMVRPQPGDMLMLRASGFNGTPSPTDRPFHRVGGNISSDPARISVAFRHDLTPGVPHPQHLLRGGWHGQGVR